TLPYFGSGRISRLGTSRRRGIFHLLFASVGIFFRHRKNHFGFHLLDPQRVTTLIRRATRETAPV
ncbi:hypothetical protein, partial [Klebsiella aerogenes]|uniref:hypothetical protein n=1 Tax=Klebsiella aerogenes TaxID=548 RepID=UPI001CC3E472